MKLLATALLTLTVLVCAAQKKSKKEKLSAEQTSQLLNFLFDSTQFVKQSADNACKCIDSIDVTNKEHKELSEEVADCIDKQVMTYQLSAKLIKSMAGDKTDKKIEITTDKKSAEYKQYYYDIERWLNDSCKSLRIVAASNNKQSDYSTSSNTEALKFYNDGIKEMRAENYLQAITLFENAVKIDEKFTFAWDNLGVCARKAKNYEKALEAYSKSLEIDPKGKTPLYNIPVVYSYMQNYDKAIAAYEKLAAIYPGDPEVFYGIGNIYTYAKPDMEKALNNMCKAYSLYIEQKSPYRTDAENAISYIFGQMKKAGKEEDFNKILKEHNISPTKK